MVGLAMLGSGLFVLFIARPRAGRQAAFMKSSVIQSAVMLLTIVLVLGGIGVIIGSAMELIGGEGV